MAKRIEFSYLKGKVIKRILGLEEESGKVLIETAEGDIIKMYHDQDCCEYVRIADVNGDIESVVGTEIIVAEERTSSADEDVSMSGTWTFYTIRTIKGTLDIRWLGESNGYYSERVDIDLLCDENYILLYPSDWDSPSEYLSQIFSSPFTALDTLEDWIGFEQSKHLKVIKEEGFHNIIRLKVMGNGWESYASINEIEKRPFIF